VNVSTGEEFEIREHYKVSFIPDADLKNAVNQPYAHLEPVELDGGNESAAAAQIEKKTVTAKEKSTKNAKSNEEMTQSEYTDSPKGPKKIKRSTIMWILFFIVIAVLGIWSWISNEQRRRENSVKINEIELVDSLEADATLQQDLAALAVESDTTGTKTADDSLEAIVQSVAQEPGTAKPAATEASQKPTAPAVKTNSAPVKQAMPTAKPAAKPIAPTNKQNVPPVKQAPPTASQKLAVAPIKKPAKTTTPVIKHAETKTTVTPDKLSTAPASGDLATIVLTPGNRLTLLALQYYGHKAFWVYIYQANKSVIKNPNNIPTGTTIRIPKPDPKIINAQDPALVAKAKALQLQILGQK
jgi:phage tail protein X